MKKAFCDSCGAKIAEPKPEGVYKNLDLFMDVYEIQVTITKSQVPQEFCRECRVRIVSNAILIRDRYFGSILPGDDQLAAAAKRKQRRRMLTEAKQAASVQ